METDDCVVVVVGVGVAVGVGELVVVAAVIATVAEVSAYELKYELVPANVA